MKLGEYLEGYSVFRQLRKVDERVPCIEKYRANLKKEHPLIGVAYMYGGIGRARKALPLESAKYEDWMAGTKVTYITDDFNKNMQAKTNILFCEFFRGLSKLKTKNASAYCYVHKETIQLLVDIYKNGLQHSNKDKKNIEKILNYLLEELPDTNQPPLGNHKSIEQDAVRQRIAFELEFINQVKGK